ncbi:unnamed protein product [Adineta steineri]|uniref:Uncharacterized protein n=1 Tax=Adineta steineri TaxID=433720 RepID=A0A815GIA4_9BILA|nr:unnamed protein product [Adineta steineri]CAF3500737.1 unnamed protein product [Adineta steineri]
MLSCSIFAVSLASIFLCIIFLDKTCHTIPMMFVANSCLAEIIFGSCTISMTLFTLQNDLKQIWYYNSFCNFLGYYGYVVTSIQNCSYLLPAIYRYFLVIYPNNSVNCGREIPIFPSPFFVFTKKIKTRAVSAKQMSMSTPIQLLLFASDQVDVVESNLICLDNWLMLNMNTDLASKIVSIRPAIEALIIRCTQQPNDITSRPLSVEQLCNLIRLLSDQQLEHVLCENIIENNETKLINE